MCCCYTLAGNYSRTKKGSYRTIFMILLCFWYFSTKIGIFALFARSYLILVTIALILVLFALNDGHCVANLVHFTLNLVFLLTS